MRRERLGSYPMHDPSMNNPAYRSLTDRQLAAIDALCERFDQELLSGSDPRIEHFLALAPDSDRSELLSELLAIELEYLARRGYRPRPEEYLSRFPQCESAISSVFAEQATLRISDEPTGSIPADLIPILPNYRLIEVIGRGGMGVVWMAEQEHPIRRRVALKFIKSDLSATDVIARFESEKQALARMDHPNIAQILDAGHTSDDRPYFVMELVDGIPITRYCDNHQLSVDDRLKLFIPVCKAVQHAHQKGIIHRDLKPSNVLVTVIDGVAVPKVIDFGLAKATASNRALTDKAIQTEYGKIIGTIQYMSPEQAGLEGASSQDIDTRADVYSLGVVLYELLTGSPPLDPETLKRNSMLNVLELVRDQEPPRPSQRLDSFSIEAKTEIGDRRNVNPAKLKQLLQGELDWVAMKALEKDRSRRYPTANDLAQDLSNYLLGETVAARPPSTWYQVRKFSRRNRGLVAAILAIGVALLGGMAGTTYGLFRANEERGKAEASEQRVVRENANAQASEHRAIQAERLAVEEARHARIAEVGAKFQLANARWDAGRAMEARSLLHQIPQEFRDNFEWHYCHRRFQGSDITCYGHINDVYATAFTPDGTRVVSADGDGEIKQWDAVTGREIDTFGVDRGRVLSLAVNADGTRIASAGDDKAVVVRDALTRDILHECRGHLGPINGVAFHPADHRIASVSEDKTVKIWDTDSGREILTITGHTAAVKGVAFSPDGEQLASVSMDRSIRIWDAKTGKPITVIKRHVIELHSVAFSPDGTRLVASSYGHASLWDAQTWKLIAETGIHDRNIRCVAFSPDGTQFATGGDDSKIKLWDARSGTLIRTLGGHVDTVWSVAYCPDGSRLVSCSKDRTVRIWDSSGKDRTTRIGGDSGTDNSLTLLGHSGYVFSVAFSSQGDLFASSGSTGTILLRNAQTYEVLFKLKGHENTDINELAFSPDGSRLISAGDDGTIRLWDTRTGREVAALKGHVSWVRGVAFSPDGTRIASAGRDGTIKIWDAQTYQETATLTGHEGDVYCVRFSRDGTRLASSGFDEKLKIWDSRTGKEIRSFRGHIGRVRVVAFDPRGERIASGGYDQSVRVWDIATGNPLATTQLRTGAVFGLAYSPDGRRIAAGYTDMAIKLFDATTCDEILPFDLGNSGASRLAFSPNGERLAVTASGIARIRIFDARPKHETSLLGEHADRVVRITFSSDGSRLYSESANEKRVWDVATRELLPDASWDPPEKPRQTSPDGRWFATAESSQVVLVDLEYKSSPDEAGWRMAKARFDHFWHHERAIAATQAESWCAAVFHYAQLVQHGSNQKNYLDDLQLSHQKLILQFGTPKGNQLFLRFSR